MTGLLESLVVPGIWGAELEDRGQPVDLHAEEKHIVAGASARRVRDFALGRACARMALAEAGRPQAITGRSEDGSPLWPDGFTGSITHTDGYAAALVSRTFDFATLGVDAEQIHGVDTKMWPRLFDEDERRWLGSLDTNASLQGAALLFSAKEACFKARPQGKSLVFHAIHIEVARGLAGRIFVARQAGLADAQGHFAMDAERVVTALFLRER